MSDWRWSDGKTLQGNDGKWIARIHYAHPSKRTDPPHPAARWAAGWEIEGYGDTPESAIRDLKRKYRKP